MTSQTESQTTPAAHGFDGLGLLPNILNRLTNAGFHQPTPIQAQSIPIAVEGKDLHTGIDLDMQRLGEQLMQQAVGTLKPSKPRAVHM
jgi:hypothetical protein